MRLFSPNHLLGRHITSLVHDRRNASLIDGKLRISPGEGEAGLVLMKTERRLMAVPAPRIVTPAYRLNNRRTNDSCSLVLWQDVCIRDGGVVSGLSYAINSFQGLRIITITHPWYGKSLPLDLKAVVLLLVLKTINVSSLPPRYFVTSHPHAPTLGNCSETLPGTGTYSIMFGFFSKLERPRHQNRYR